jgi:hypothetical protein
MDCYKCRNYKCLVLRCPPSVALGRVWWWAQNWAQLPRPCTPQVSIRPQPLVFVRHCKPELVEDLAHPEGYLAPAAIRASEKWRKRTREFARRRTWRQFALLVVLDSIGISALSARGTSDRVRRPCPSVVDNCDLTFRGIIREDYFLATLTQDQLPNTEG